MVGFGQPVYKYRCKCSDLKRGTQGGFRIVAVYRKNEELLLPVLIYGKWQQGTVPTRQVKGAVTELLNAIQAARANAPAQPSEQSPPASPPTTS